jgi:mRNA interferase HigB
MSNAVLDMFARSADADCATIAEHAMWVVSIKRLREFWARCPLAEMPSRAWFAQASAAEWRNFSDLRDTFPSADLVGNCTIFNIGGNKFRLVARLFYTSHKVYLLHVMTHAEYDREAWPVQCGCHLPPPKRREQKKPSSKKRTSKRRPKS